MIDMHYDLLSILYKCYLENDYRYVEKWSSYYNQNNVSGLLANLYFMNPMEMKKELGEDYPEINVLEMFRVATELFQKYFPNTKVIYSIEGCDYIKDTAELEQLAGLGLKNILLVWNNPNKYGSGNVSNQGLTELGKEFIIKAIDLGISIDLSHMNQNTFRDTVALLKEQRGLGKKVKVIASHSNCYRLCNHPRNLDDWQLRELRELDGILGLVSYTNFVGNGDVDYKEKYLEHVKYAVDIMGIDYVGVSSDNMMFGNYFYGDHYSEIFEYKNMKEELRTLLLKEYSEEDVEKILFRNVENKLFKEEEKW